jgi:hypothetical protein
MDFNFHCIDGSLESDMIAIEQLNRKAPPPVNLRADTREKIAVTLFNYLQYSGFASIFSYLARLDATNFYAGNRILNLF